MSTAVSAMCNGKSDGGRENEDSSDNNEVGATKACRATLLSLFCIDVKCIQVEVHIAAQCRRTYCTPYQPLSPCTERLPLCNTNKDRSPSIPAFIIPTRPASSAHSTADPPDSPSPAHADTATAPSTANSSEYSRSSRPACSIQKQSPDHAPD